MNSFHFTLGSSRVPRVRWFTGLQCGNPWFIANTLACHCAIPDTMVAYAPCLCISKEPYTLSPSLTRLRSPRYLEILAHVFASGRREVLKMKTLATVAVAYTLSAYDVDDGGSSEPIIPCSSIIYLCARDTFTRFVTDITAGDVTIIPLFPIFSMLFSFFSDVIHFHTRDRSAFALTPSSFSS